MNPDATPTDRPRLRAIRTALSGWTAVAAGFTWLLMLVVSMAHPAPWLAAPVSALGLIALFTTAVALNDTEDDEQAIADAVIVTVGIVVCFAAGVGMGWVWWGR